MLNLFTFAGASERVALKAGIGVVLLLITALSFAALNLPIDRYEQVLTLLLILVGAAGTGFVLLARPPLGFAALIVLALMLRLEIATGTQVSLNGAFLMAAAVVAFWGVAMLSQGRNLRVVPSRAMMPLGLFLVVAVLSFIVGQFPWFPTAGAPLPAQLGGLAIFLLSGGVFLAAAHQLTAAWLRRITFLFLFLGGLHIILWFTPGPDGLAHRFIPTGVMGSMFWTWYVALGLGQALGNRELNPFWRITIGGLVLAALYAGMYGMRSWISGWMPGLIAVFVIISLRVPIVTFTVALIAGIVAAFNTDQVVRFIMIGDQPYSLLTRFEAMRSLWPVLSANPLLGLGPANYYHYTRLYPIMGWHVKFNSHNNYIDIVAQTGLVGLAALLWFFGETGRIGWKMSRRLCPGFSQAYVHGVMGGLAGTLAAGVLGDWFLPFVYNVGLQGFGASVLAWLFLGGLIALERDGGKA